APHLSSDLATHIEAKVDLLEVTMKRNRQAEDFRIQKLKPDQTGKVLSLPRIERRPGRNIRLKNRRLHLVIDHRQVVPGGGEEGSGLHSARLLFLRRRTCHAETRRARRGSNTASPRLRVTGFFEQVTGTPLPPVRKYPPLQKPAQQFDRSI